MSYASSLASAKRQLAARGQPVTITTVTQSNYDPTTSALLTSSSSIVTNGVLFPLSMGVRGFKYGTADEPGTTILSSDQQLILPGDIEQPPVGATAGIGASDYTILAVSPINPGGTCIIYDCVVRGAGPTAPQLLSVSDFVNEAYTLRGAAKTFGELWQWGDTYDPGITPDNEGNTPILVPGVGITVTGTCPDEQTVLGSIITATPELFAAVAVTEGVTLVMDYIIDYGAGDANYPNGSPSPLISVNIQDEPTYQEWWTFEHKSTHHLEMTASESPGVPNLPADDNPLTYWGAFRAAVTLSQEELAYCLNGPQGIVGPHRAPYSTISANRGANAFNIAVLLTHQSTIPATGTLQRVSVYRATRENYLPVLVA